MTKIRRRKPYSASRCACLSMAASQTVLQIRITFHFFVCVLPPTTTTETNYVIISFVILDGAQV